MTHDAAKVCLITSVGPGTGGALVDRFCAAGYTGAMIARSVERLDEIAATQPLATPYKCDVSDTNASNAVMRQVNAELGAPDIVIRPFGGNW